MEISPSNLDWRGLSKTYEENSFDAIICIGNSLTCLFGRKNHLKALKEFHTLLKPRGVLIIDERNFQNILDNRHKALKDHLHLTGKYYYTGQDKVATRFPVIREDVVIGEYRHKQSGKKAYYKVYPFKKRELLGLLRETGFSQIESFSDFKKEEDPKADFYQYVCSK